MHFWLSMIVTMGCNWNVKWQFRNEFHVWLHGIWDADTGTQRLNQKQMQRRQLKKSKSKLSEELSENRRHFGKTGRRFWTEVVISAMTNGLGRLTSATKLLVLLVHCRIVKLSQITTNDKRANKYWQITTKKILKIKDGLDDNRSKAYKWWYVALSSKREE